MRTHENDGIRRATAARGPAPCADSIWTPGVTRARTSENTRRPDTAIIARAGGRTSTQTTPACACLGPCRARDWPSIPVPLRVLHAFRLTIALQMPREYRLSVDLTAESHILRV